MSFSQSHGPLKCESPRAVPGPAAGAAAPGPHPGPPDRHLGGWGPGTCVKQAVWCRLRSEKHCGRPCFQGQHSPQGLLCDHVKFIVDLLNDPNPHSCSLCRTHRCSPRSPSPCYSSNGPSVHGINMKGSLKCFECSFKNTADFPIWKNKYLHLFLVKWEAVLNSHTASSI